MAAFFFACFIPSKLRAFYYICLIYIKPIIMEDFKVKFSSAVRPGLIVSLVVIALSLLLQTFVQDIKTQQYIGYVIWVIVLALLVFFGIQYRDNEAEGFLTYGKAFTFLFYMSIIMAVFSTIYSYVNFTYIHPDIVDQILDNAEEAMYNQGMDGDKIEQALEIQAKFITPGWMSFWAFFANIIFSTIVSLIGAIFVKKN